MFALPPQIGRTTDVPDVSYHSREPWSGFLSRRTWTFQVPNRKSKSCCPSVGLDAAGESAPVAAFNGGSARIWGTQLNAIKITVESRMACNIDGVAMRHPVIGQWSREIAK